MSTMHQLACTKYAGNKLLHCCFAGICLIPQWEQRLEKK